MAPVSHEESLNCGAGGVFHESQEKRPLTTQDILEHEDSFDCGGDAGDIVMGVQEDSFVPRRIRKKQPRADGTRLPFFHHFFARTVLTAEEQQIIDDINAFGLCRLLHQWASGLLEYAQSAVQEELRYLASTSAYKRDPFQDEFPQSSSTDVGCDWLLDRPTWHVEVLNSSTVSENEVTEKEDNVAGRQGFVSAEMYRDFLSAEDRRPKISDMPQNIVDLRHQVLSILQRIFKLHGRGVILDQIHVVRFSSSDHSRLKLGITTACDFSTSSLESSILETWLRYLRPFKLAGFSDARLIEVGHVLRLEKASLQLRHIARALHSARAKYADTEFPYRFGYDLEARHGRGSGSCEVYHDSDTLCNYFVRMLQIACKNSLVRFPWQMQMPWSVVKALGLRTEVLKLAPKAFNDRSWCIKCWFQRRLRISTSSIRGELGFDAKQHRIACPWDDKKHRRRRKFLKRESRREKREKDLDLDDDHSLSSVLQRFLDEECEWCDRVAATPIAVIKKAAAEYCGIKDVRELGPLFTALGIKSEARATAAGGRILTRSTIDLRKAGNCSCLSLLPKS